MEKFEILYSICLDNKNVNALLEIIRDDIKLSERSLSKCSSMIREIMKKNIGKLSKPPRDREEFKETVRYLNKLCVSTIIDIIAKKYPDLQIYRKKQISKEQMKRDLDVWGDRENHVQDRPYTKSKKEYDDDEVFYSMKPNDIGFSGTDENYGYASAFGNHLITNVPVGQKQPIFNNPHKDSSQIEQRFQQMVDERNYNARGQQRPPTPDFTLDGTGEKVKQQKMLRKMQEEQINTSNMGGMMGNGMPGGMMDMGIDDPYASLLGAGAPSQNMGQTNPFMGMGNPLMPMSSTNMIANQMGFNNMSSLQGGYNLDNQNISAKSMQLQNDFEKKLAERHMVDMETNQPQQSNQNYGNQMSMMGSMNNIGNTMPNMSNISNMSNMSNIPMPNMSMPNMSMPNMSNMSNMQMPNMSNMSNMQMPNMQMPNMQIPNMSNMQIPNMSNMQMPNMSNMSDMSNMSNMPMSSMPMSNMPMQNISNTQMLNI